MSSSSRWLTSALHIVWITTALLAAQSTAAAELSGRVVGVADGDTLTVLDNQNVQHKIRLAAIDAPERRQAFGSRSRLHLRELTLARQAQVEWHKTDRYGRKVGRVMVADPSCTEPECPKTVDAGMAQLTVGLAWWYRQYANEQTAEQQGQYEFAEFEAKAKRVGLWSDAQPTPPWAWRASQRQQPP